MTRPARTPALLVSAAMLASTLAPAPALAQRVEVGNVASVAGEVTISNEQMRRPRDVQRRERVAWGDLFETGKKSQAQILLIDRTTFGIGARSQVRIDRYVYDPDAGRSVFATMLEGALRFFSGRQDEDNTAEIESPAGRIGIRGTALDLLVGEEARDIAESHDFVGNVDSKKKEATLVVLRGPGAGTAGGLTPGLAEVTGAGVTVVLDEPGLAAYIPRNGAAPIGPFRISDAALADLQDELAPRVADAAGGGGGLLKALIPIAVGAAAVGILSTRGGGGNSDATGANTAGGNNGTPSVPTPNSTPRPSPSPSPSPNNIPGTTNNGNNNNGSNNP